MDPAQPNPNQPLQQPQQPPQSEQAATPVAPTQPPAPDATKPFPKKLALIAGGGALILLIIIAVIFGLSGRKSSNGTVMPTPTKAQSGGEVKATPVTRDPDDPQKMMIYGTWTGQTTVVRGVDIGSSESLNIATLPLEVKKISVLSSQNLMYIDQVDTKELGRRITIYNLKTKTSSQSIPASSGYGIEDYALSPDKKYITIWEVQFGSTTQSLLGGKSRIYAIDLSRPTVKNILYDETVSTTIPIHYPIGILNNGTVFADTLIPSGTNGSKDWAYGMSVVDFDGTNKRDIESMKKGTYGTQPALSPDGKYLLFAGYDGSKGNDPAGRQAIMTPNTIDVLNTESLKRFTLPNLSSTNTYPTVSWESQTGRIFFAQFSLDTQKTNSFSYDLGKQKPTEIVIPIEGDSRYGYVEQLNDAKALIGAQDLDPSNLGNLGNAPAYAYTQLALLDVQTSKVNFVSVQDAFVQYITVLPTTYFKSTLGEAQ